MLVDRKIRWCYNVQMTLPDERYRSLRDTLSFLMSLTNPLETPRVPGSVRRQARALLKHYPSQFYLDQLAEKSPEVIIERMEPLTRLVMTYQQEKPDDDAS